MWNKKKERFKLIYDQQCQSENNLLFFKYNGLRDLFIFNPVFFSTPIKRTKSRVNIKFNYFRSYRDGYIVSLLYKEKKSVNFKFI